MPSLRAVGAPRRPAGPTAPGSNTAPAQRTPGHSAFWLLPSPTCTGTAPGAPPLPSVAQRPLPRLIGPYLRPGQRPAPPQAPARPPQPRLPSYGRLTTRGVCLCRTVAVTVITAEIALAPTLSSGGQDRKAALPASPCVQLAPASSPAASWPCPPSPSARTPRFPWPPRLPKALHRGVSGVRRPGRGVSAARVRRLEERRLALRPRLLPPDRSGEQVCGSARPPTALRQASAMRCGAVGDSANVPPTTSLHGGPVAADPPTAERCGAS